MKTEEQKVIDELYFRDERILPPSNEIFEGIKVNGQKIPDPKLHQRISFLKSAIRILACFLGGIGYFEVGFFILGVAEVVGIVEELV
jgi:hypothetical protein